MAERANGGTSIAERMSSAATRPAASPSGVSSVRSIGTTAESRRWRASPREIVDVKGRTNGFLVQGSGFWVLGFRVLGFRVLGFNASPLAPEAAAAGSAI